MQNQKPATFGILPKHSQLLALIAAHGLPAFMEGVSDALANISCDANLAKSGAPDGSDISEVQQWAELESVNIMQSLVEDSPFSSEVMDG